MKEQPYFINKTFDSLYEKYLRQLGSVQEYLDSHPNTHALNASVTENNSDGTIKLQ